MRLTLSIPLLLFCAALSLTSTAQEIDSAYQENIDTLFNWNSFDCFGDVPNYVSKLNYSKDSIIEHWFVCDMGNDGKGMKIEYWDYSDPEFIEFHHEAYYSYKGELFYANIGENYCFPDIGCDGTWEGWYNFQHDVLFDFHTNGHGLSETDTWDPEKWVLDKHKKRLLEWQELTLK